VDRSVPQISDLTPAALPRARIVVLHGPRAVDGRTTWLLSIVDLDGRVVARDIVAEHGVRPLDHLVQPSLDLIGRRVDGEWVSDQDAAGQPRHRARLA
jgi:hypothetical protein